MKGNHHISQLLIFDMDAGWSSHGSGIGANQTYVAEPIMEYLASAYFRNQGYIVDKFNERLSSSRKNLDLFAISYPDLQSILSNHDIGNSGLYLCELESPLWGKKKNRVKKSEDREITAVIEAESSRGSESSGYKQVKTDLKNGEFNHGYVSAPFIKEKDREDIGIVTFDNKGSLFTEECLENYADGKKSSELLQRVERIIKLALLKNIPISKVLDLLPPINSFWEIYNSVEEISLSSIVQYVRKHHRTEKEQKRKT
ncbi:hypothetical protein AKJ64_00880 [candidate division MSBL1 archaeon SCGC-AAA259E17]|uniref:Uncharacterized protein n=1 Tax=candidate division MSBL1 archaeon SCGC-AAA259E17 TaxID=1698263 RepID=A0A133UGI2_9EURY|nr:hypothetical protein AKJ64_00880 [candidate division MSBL1 archaeon SCGC-AAA259E17]